jgi:hypothetical protein
MISGQQSGEAVNIFCSNIWFVNPIGAGTWIRVFLRENHEIIEEKRVKEKCNG